MKHFLIRHAKTDANRQTRAAYGQYGAPINEVGIQQANALRQKLIKLGIDVEHETVAVSELLRTKQTAEAAGLKHFVVYNVLNEISFADPKVGHALIDRGELPAEATEAARRILANPPKERIWVTHGQVIAGLLHELGLPRPARLIPDFCEILVIEL